MQYIALSLLAFVQIVLSIILSYKKHSRVSRIFVYFTVALSLWTFANIVHGLSLDGLGGYNLSSRLNLLNWSNQIGFFTGTLTLTLLYLLVLFFPVERKLTVWSRIVIAIGAVVSVVALTPLVAGYYTLESPDSQAQYVYSALSLIVPLYYVVVSAEVVRAMFSVLRTTTDTKVKLQTKTILSSLLITGGLAVIIIVVIPFVSGNDSFIFLGYYAPYVFAFSLFYSIFKQGFLDFRALVVRSVAYIVSIAIILLLFVGFSVSVVQALAGSVSKAQALLFAALTVPIAILFNPAKRFFDRITSRYFYQDAYDPQLFLYKLNWVLVSYSDLDRMLLESSGLIRDTLKAKFCVFSAPDPMDSKNSIVIGDDVEIDLDALSYINEYMSGANAGVVVVDDLDSGQAKIKQLLSKKGVAVLVRVSFSDALGGGRDYGSGFILIGDKKSGSFYSNGDVDMLATIANSLIIAMQNAYRFEEIKNFNKTLQQKVDSATRELKRKNERLRILDQTKDDFISMASHQLRTPLTSVKGYISMVLDGDAGKTNELQRKLLTQSFVSAQRMVYLISDLLNVSRLRTGKFVIEPMESNLARVIEEEVEQLSETAKSHGLTLVYNKPQNFPELMLDETKLRQVIMNFIDNAIYYTPHGGRIEVSLVEKPQSVEFTVVDNGIGVPKHEQHRLFTKFFRAHNAKNVRPDGTGLGIFMAKKVIVAQGGAIIFKSTEGKGSTFGFTFPKARLLPKPKPTDNPSAASKPATKISIKSDSDSRAKSTAKSA